MSINYQEFLEFLEGEIRESLDSDYSYWEYLESIKQELIRNHEAWLMEEENSKHDILNELLYDDFKSSILLADRGKLIED